MKKQTYLIISGINKGSLINGTENVNGWIDDFNTCMIYGKSQVVKSGQIFKETNHSLNKILYFDSIFIYTNNKKFPIENFVHLFSVDKLTLID